MRLGLRKNAKCEKKCEITVSHIFFDLNPCNHAGLELGHQLSEKVRSVLAHKTSEKASHFLTLLQTSRKPP